MNEHIDEVLTWDEKASHSAEPTLLLPLDTYAWLGEAKERVQSWCTFLLKGLGLFQPEVLDIAVTAEFIHNASLLHDDVIDNGELRRGQPTVNVVWDSLTAVLAGDILLSESIRILKTAPESLLLRL